YPTLDEVIIQIGTHSGVQKMIVFTDGSSAGKYQRTGPDTIPWTTASRPAEAVSDYRGIAPQGVVINGANWCCNFVCDANYHFNDFWHDCFSGAGGCEVCTYRCTTQYPICPAGWKKLMVLN